MAVIINGKTVVHQNSLGKLHTLDVCLTPPYGAPIPFKNLAKSEDLIKTARSVRVNGYPIATMQSEFCKSTGDEGGLMLGITSGSIGGKATFLEGSHNVKAEGFPVVRQHDHMVSNNRNTPPAPLMQPGGSPAPIVQQKINKLLNPNPTDYVMEIDITGTAGKVNALSLLIVHNDYHAESQPINAKGLEAFSNPVTRRLSITDVDINDAYLSLRLDNKSGRPIDIPLTNQAIPVRNKVETNSPKTGKAKNVLVPCHIAWANHPSNN